MNTASEAPFGVSSSAVTFACHLYICVIIRSFCSIWLSSAEDNVKRLPLQKTLLRKHCTHSTIITFPWNYRLKFQEKQMPCNINEIPPKLSHKPCPDRKKRQIILASIPSE